MISLISISITVLSICFSKIIYRKWLNPLSLYAVIWGGMIFLYGFRLLPLIDLSTEAWIIIILSYLSFILGGVLVYTARDYFSKSNEFYKWKKDDIFIFYKNGKYLNLIILILSTFGLLAAIQHWLYLLKEYGSFAEIFIHAQRVYRYRIDNINQGAIPFVWLLSYVSIFLSGIYTAYKKRLTLGALISILGISLKALATFTRGGILFGFLEFIIGFVVFRYILKENDDYKNSSNIRMLFGSLFLILILVASASIVKLSRTGMDSYYKGASSNISKFEGGGIISPSVYFYLTSQIAVLSKYLDDEYQNNLFAENTLFPIYRFLGKFDLVKKPKFESKGYYVPTWSNTSTYLGNLHKDFGYSGIFLGPFLLGVFVTYFWYKVLFDGELANVIILSFLILIIGMSFFALQLTVVWWTSILISYLVFNFLRTKSQYTYSI